MSTRDQIHCTARRVFLHDSAAEFAVYIGTRRKNRFGKGNVDEDTAQKQSQLSAHA